MELVLVNSHLVPHVEKQLHIPEARREKLVFYVLEPVVYKTQFSLNSLVCRIPLHAVCDPFLLLAGAVH